MYLVWSKVYMKDGKGNGPILADDLLIRVVICELQSKLI